MPPCKAGTGAAAHTRRGGAHLGCGRHQRGALDGDLVDSGVDVGLELVAYTLVVGLVVHKFGGDLDAGDVLVILPVGRRG